MGQATADESRTTCPECGARLQHDPGFTVWCDRCDWNVDPYPPDTEELDLVARVEQRMERRFGQRLYAELATGVPLRPHRDAASVMAQVLAVGVHASTLALVAIGIWFVFGGMGFAIAGLGVLMLVIAFVLRPRFGKFPEHALTLDRAEAPELFGLVDEVARAAGTRGPDRVVVGRDYNAFVTEYGIRGRRLLSIGLPLWQILSPEQRVALLGHEFGHFTNGDPRYGGMVGAALRSLAGWGYLLAPNEYREEEGNPLDVVITILTFVPYVIVLGTLLLMYRLTLRSSQRGEYLADRLGARVGGTTAAMEMLDRLGLDAFVERATVRVRARLGAGARGSQATTAASEQLWDGVAAEVAAVPEHEFERLRRVGAKRDQSVDSTHPPTHLRREVLALAAPTPPEVLVDAGRSARIDAELARVRQELGEQVLNPSEW